MRQQVESTINSTIRPYLRSMGMDVDLLSVAGSVVTLQIRGEPEDITRISLRVAVEMKIQELVPTVTSVEFLG